MRDDVKNLVKEHEANAAGPKALDFNFKKRVEGSGRSGIYKGIQVDNLSNWSENLTKLEKCVLSRLLQVDAGKEWKHNHDFGVSKNKGQYDCYLIVLAKDHYKADVLVSSFTIKLTKEREFWFSGDCIKQSDIDEPLNNFVRAELVAMADKEFQ